MRGAVDSDERTNILDRHSRAFATVGVSDEKVNGDGLVDDGVERDMGVSHFNWSQFWASILPQFLFPFSILFIAPFAPGYAANILALARPGTLVESLVALNLTFMLTIPFVTIVAWALLPHDTDKMIAGTLRADAIHVAACLTSIRLAICIKYAYLSPKVFAERLRHWATTKERRKEQLITGWLTLSKKIIHQEVAATVLRNLHHGSRDAVLQVEAKDLPRLLAILSGDAARAIIVTALGLNDEAAREANKGTEAEAVKSTGAEVEAAKSTVGAYCGEVKTAVIASSAVKTAVIAASPSLNDQLETALREGGDLEPLPLRTGLRGGVAEAAVTSVRAAAAADANATIPVPASRLLHIPASSFVEALELSAQHGVTSITHRASGLFFLLSIITTFGSTFIRYIFHLPILGTSTLESVVIIGHWISNIFIMGATFLFLAIAAIDHRRRAITLQSLGLFFSPGTRAGRSTEPVLFLDSFEQTRAFFAVREMCLTFGCVFHERLIRVSSMQLVVFIMLAGYSIITLFLADGGDTGPLVSAYIVLIVLVMPAFIVCAFGLWEAAKANDEAHRHVSIIANVRIAMRLAEPANVRETGFEATTTTATTRASELSQLLILLTDVERCIKEQHEASSISILGIPATWSLAQNYVGFVISLATLGTTLFLSRLTVRVA